MRDSGQGAGVKEQVVWLLVENAASGAAFEAVAAELRGRGARAEVVTITGVLGTMAREVFAGGAERLLRGLRVAMQGRGADEDLIGAVRSQRPDALVVTSARPVRALSMLESLTGLEPLQLGVLPNYNFNDSWVRSGLHGFVVPHEEQRERLVRSGVSAERVLIAGPAIQAGFAQQLDRAAQRAGFGFGEAERVVLVRADVLDHVTLERVVFQSRLVEGARFIFHHNGDGSAASTLRRAAAEYSAPGLMFGKVPDLERYVAAADVVLTGAADPLLPEAIAQAKPLMLVGPVGEYGEQASFIERWGMGRSVEDLVRLGAELERFLRPDSLGAAAAAAGKIGLPSGSREVADAILDALGRAAQWKSSPAQAGAGPVLGGGQAPGAGTVQGPSGPFEAIGGVGSPQVGTAGSGSRSVTLSRAEAKEQLAELILRERELERRLQENEREQQRWRSRLDMAREWREADLEQEAEAVLRGYMQQAQPLQESLRAIQVQKEKLRQAAAGDGSSAGSAAAGASLSAAEQRWQRMEQDRDIQRLKDRMEREFGD
jgi:hypothetical protein